MESRVGSSLGTQGEDPAVRKRPRHPTDAATLEPGREALPAWAGPRRTRRACQAQGAVREGSVGTAGGTWCPGGADREMPRNQDGAWTQPRGTRGH